MRITLNLATRPFVELRPVYLRLRLLMLALIVLAVPLWFLLRAEAKKAAVSSARVEALQANIARLERQQQNYQALMRQPQNAAVLAQSDFLNDLFRRKAFSWTAIMMDLENVLPAGVQVQSIEPAVAPSGDVTIRMRISGARERSIELIRNLEHSRHFAQPRIASEALQTAATSEGGAQPVSASNDVNFDVLAEYRPLSETETVTPGAKGKTSAKPKKQGQQSATPGAQKHTARRHPLPPAPGGRP
jgi:type IV pilus assembly protein PilN